MTYRILLVEDNVQICRMIADYFSAQPDNICQLDTVQNGADGLDAARSGEYDLILLDVMLPDLDGFSICRSIRAVSDIPLLFLTARAREEDVLYGYTLGCDDYVVKPFSLATLYAKVLALLKRSCLRRHHAQSADACGHSERSARDTCSKGICAAAISDGA